MECVVLQHVADIFCLPQDTVQGAFSLLLPSGQKCVTPEARRERLLLSVALLPFAFMLFFLRFRAVVVVVLGELYTASGAVGAWLLLPCEENEVGSLLSYFTTERERENTCCSRVCNGGPPFS